MLPGVLYINPLQDDGTTGNFEVTVGGELIHSKRQGKGGVCLEEGERAALVGQLKKVCAGGRGDGRGFLSAHIPLRLLTWQHLSAAKIAIPAVDEAALKAAAAGDAGGCRVM